MSYAFYKIVHVVSIVIFFSLFAKAAYSQSSQKMDKILTGIALLIIFVAGMGLVAKTGASQGGDGWPLWLKFKLVIWLIIGIAGHVSLKRFPQHGVKVFWGSVGFLTFASYLANYKPF
jgi:uncharacterized membrane protein SirB2